MAQFKPGDRVNFLNETGGGIIARIVDEHTVEVTTADGFDFPYAISELVSATVEEDYQLSDKAFPRPSFQPKKVAWIKEKNKSFPEIDLHIQELRESWRTLSNFEILQIQLDHFKHWMDKARGQRMEKIIFIHGLGEGVLRNELRNRLEEDYLNIEYFDAAFKTYGFGATEVRFRYN